jgi:hypothetical protein
MPDPKDNAKASGDVHLPEVEDQGRRSSGGRPVAEDVDPAAAERSQQDESRPGKGENQAGYLKDKEAPGPGEGSRSR